jgi:hypothetical protein
MFTFRKYHRLNQQLIIIKEVLVTVSKEVQSILDRTKKNSDLVKSVDLGMKALGKQVSDLQAQISALPVGNVLSDEDKSALATAASDLDNSINTLQSDIPANTDQGGNARGPGQSVNNATQGSGEQSADNAQGTQGAPKTGDANADSSAPQPLPGTGAGS